MNELALKTPTKDVKKVERVEKLEFDIFDDAPREESLVMVNSCTVEATETVVDLEEAKLTELRNKFVGEVDVTEGSRHGLLPSQRAPDRLFRSRAIAH